VTDVMVVRTKQRVMTEFLTVEGFSPTEIHRSLRNVYGSIVSAVKRSLLTGPAEGDQPRQ